MQIHVQFRDQASDRLHQVAAGLLGDRTELHATMAMGVEAAIIDHLRTGGYIGRTNALGAPSTGYWGHLANSVASTADQAGALVSIPHRGAALHYYGGIVKPTQKKALSIPADPSAHGVYARAYPQILAFIPRGARHDQHIVGFLVLGKKVTATRGRNKGQPVTRPMSREEGGKLIYVLRDQTTHQPDPGMLPAEERLRDAAAQAGRAYLDNLLN